VPNGPANMWRDAPVLPPADQNIVKLREGWTPLVHTKRMGAQIGAVALGVKDEVALLDALPASPRPSHPLAQFEPFVASVHVV
jgi:hypothetical protein